MGKIIDIKSLFGFWEYHHTKGELEVSSSIRKMLNLPQQMFKCSPEDIASFLNVHEKDKFLKEFHFALEIPQSSIFHLPFSRESSGKQYIKTFFESVSNERGEVVIKGMVGDFLILSADKRANLQSRIVFDNTSEGIIITDEKGTILNVNQGFCNITGFSKEEAVGQKPSILKSGLQERLFYSTLWNQLKNEGKWRGELWNKKKNNQLFQSFQNITRIPNKLPGEAHYVSVFSDVTKEYENRKRIDELVFKDQLTGLSNRRHFETQVELQIAEKPQTSFYVLFLDLNNFKSINDNHGHAYGDVLLKKVARKLSSALVDDGLISRFGGDEFTILMSPNIDNEQKLVDIASAIKIAISNPFEIENEHHAISASIGASHYPSDGKNAATLLKSADTAMYDAKYSKQFLSFFHPEMGYKVRRKARLVQDLISALQQGQFHLEYQPKINILSGCISGYEALCRWQHPYYGRVPPPEFISVAEEFSFYAELGDWVFDTAFSDFSSILKRNPELNLSINVTASQILQPNFAIKLHEKISFAGLPCSAIELEITETELIEEMPKTVTVLEQLRTLGVSISIDDFGKGYSSFYHLRNLPVDRIKLDKDCIRDAVADEKTSVCIISAINSVATEMKLDLIVEGVESKSQNDLLRRIGVPYAQGYYYAYPQTLQQCEQINSLDVNKLSEVLY